MVRTDGGNETLFAFEAVNNMGMRRRWLTRAGTRFGSGAGDGGGGRALVSGAVFVFVIFIFN